MTDSLKYKISQDKLSGFKAIIENEISIFIKSLPEIVPLTSAISYALECGGKRNRPIILLSTLSDLGIPVEKFSAVALSLELIHVATLIHDDLPALDDDDYRRGKKTCHVMFNEATAILAGDAMVALSLDYISHVELSAKKMLNISRIISNSYRDVCYGQQLDLNTGKDRPDVTAISKLKTGSLFAAAITIPFEVYESQPVIKEKARELGLALGILYQMCDDIADYSDSKGLKGREVNSDLKNQKDTFHTLNPAATNELMLKIHQDILKLMAEIEFNLGSGHYLTNLKNALNLLFSAFPVLNLKFS